MCSLNSLLSYLFPPFFPFSLSLPPFLLPSLPLLWLFQNIIYIHLKFYSKKIISFFTPKRNDKQQHRNPFKLYLWTKKPTCTNTFIPLLLQCKLAFSCFPGRFLLTRFWFLSLLPSREPHFVIYFLSSLYLQSQALWWLILISFSMRSNLSPNQKKIPELQRCWHIYKISLENYPFMCTIGRLRSIFIK